MEIKLTLTPVQEKVVHWLAIDPQEWLQNWVNVRCEEGAQKIFEMEVARMTADPTITNIPADRDTVVLNAKVPTAAETFANNQAMIQQMMAEREAQSKQK